jgi:rare lipoprotein A
MHSHILVLTLMLAGLSDSQTVAARAVAVDGSPVIEVSSRSFSWFFEHSRPEGSCAGQFAVATWYASGRRTASGQAFNPGDYTAAHRTLPFGTRVTVINPRTGKSVTVVVNDRGPFTRGVTLDLARGAARAIGMNQTQWICML